MMTKNVKAKMARVEREESPIQQSSQNWSQEKLPMKTVSIIIKEPALCYCKYNQNQMQYSSTFKRRKKKREMVMVKYNLIQDKMSSKRKRQKATRNLKRKEYGSVKDHKLN